MEIKKQKIIMARIKSKRNPKDLKAIFFDIDDTLFSTTEFAMTARLNAVRAMIEHGLQMEVPDCFNKLNEIIEKYGSNYGEHFDRLLETIPNNKLGKVKPNILIAAAVVAYHRTKFGELKPYKDVMEVLKLLHNTELILGITSAGLVSKQSQKLVLLGLLPFFHPQAIFINPDKSDSAFYLNVCREIGLKPNQCMNIGDNPINDIDPANEIGMITVLSQRSGKYLTVKGKTKPHHIIHNMWELLDILKRFYDISIY